MSPPALLQAPASAAVTAEKAAALHPEVAPAASPGSPADGVAAAIAAGMSARATQLSAKLAGKGPRVRQYEIDAVRRGFESGAPSPRAVLDKQGGPSPVLIPM